MKAGKWNIWPSHESKTCVVAAIMKWIHFQHDDTHFANAPSFIPSFRGHIPSPSDDGGRRRRSLNDDVGFHLSARQSEG
ncbi:unnamed protein product [Soboliphyme baturini]|uniref:Uncharacterized protein n=1 Tax=Soboliphyme baturini TaxID=241478 RepID=A0A183INL6_9BILA|nr:unnamed protein product [Soboliphyme baturini]